MSSYLDFLGRKSLVANATGINVDPDTLNPSLFPFQRDLVHWSLRKGRAAIFADTGLGKTIMQLEWAHRAADRALILAPLAVAYQTVAEGDRWGIPVTYARKQSGAATQGITITNYEMLGHFDPDEFGAVVLDESSILKNFEGKTRSAIIDTFRQTPMRLACTATPAPNDIAEIANHAEFLGVMSRTEMLAAFFVHDDEGWRLKGHARGGFYKWLASWGMSLKSPADLGYPDHDYILPGLAIVPHFVEVNSAPEGMLFAVEIKGVGDRARIRRSTMAHRVGMAVEMIGSTEEPWIAWCGLNDEGSELAKAIPGSVNVEGSMDPEEKAEALQAFSAGDIRVLITKPSIAGFGMNWQHCNRMVFVGLSDSYEDYYQCIRRCYRFGQKRKVEAHIVLSELERAIYDNVLGKEREAQRVSAELVKHVAEFERAEIRGARAIQPYDAALPLTTPAWLKGNA